MNLLARSSLAVMAGGLIFAQPANSPSFEAGDLRLSPHSANIGMRGGYYPAGNRYELHQATMADLIRTAWSLEDNNRVLGGPGWLDDIRFDVLAKAPESTQADIAKIMLRTLLADRMGLVVHEDRRPLPAYVLTAGTRAPRLKAAVESSDGAGQCQPQSRPAEPGKVRAQTISCHAITMEAFARALPGLAKEYFGHYSMIDLTGLKGSWDFTLTWNTRSQLADAGSDGISLFDAMEKQLGLQLRLQDMPLPVIVVDRINDRPIETTPETLRRLPHTPTTFEVGTIKPSPPGEKPYERILPSGEVDLRVDTLKELILYAWDIAGMEGSNSELLDAPKWTNSARFDLVAKAVSEKATDAAPLDEGALRVMMRNLLISRFHMKVHNEERLVTVYALTAAKPKMTTADPATRTSCKIAPLPAGSKSPLTRNFVCRNVTMSRFAEKLRDLATDWTDHLVVDKTNLEGGWDFTLSFSSRAAMALDNKSGTDVADPDGKLSLGDALNKELGLKLETTKAPMQVLVIDSMTQEPVDN